MSRYFFHVHDGQSSVDRDGIELPSLDAARGHAARYAGELLCDKPSAFWTGEEWRMDVTDRDDLILFSLIFVAIDAPVLKRP